MMSKNLFKTWNNRFKQNAPLLTLGVLAYFFTMLIPTIFCMLDATKRVMSDTSLKALSRSMQYIIFENIITNLIVFGAGIVVAIVLFKYLNNRTEVDFYHSLPIKRGKLFLGNYFIGIVYFLIAYIGNLVISLLIWAYLIPFETDMFLNVVRLIASNLITFLVVYTVAVLACIICGNIYNTISSTIIILFAGVIYIGLIESIFEGNVKYYENNNNIWDNALANTLSPIVECFSRMGDINWVALIKICVVFGLAYYLFVKRCSENSGVPIAIKSFRIVFRTIEIPIVMMVSFIVTQAILGRSNVIPFIIWAIFFGFIAYIVETAIYESDIKKIFKNIKYYGIFAIVFSIFIICMKLDIVGYSSYLPKKEEVIGVNYRGESLHTKENIDIIYNYAQKVVKKDEADINSRMYSPGKMEFVLKNGKTVYRNYGKGMSWEECVEVETSKEMLLLKANYDLTADDIIYTNENKDEIYTKMVESNEEGKTHRIFDMAEPFLIHDNEEYILSETQFKEVYELITKDIDLLNTKYLLENIPVQYIYVELINSYGAIIRKDIPVYKIQKDAITYLNSYIFKDENKSIDKINIPYDSIYIEVTKAEGLEEIIATANSENTKEYNGNKMIDDPQQVKEILDKTIAINRLRIPFMNILIEDLKITKVYNEEGIIGYYNK